MSNTEQIEEALKNLIFEDNRAFVAMLSGEWGIGKTYFWKEIFTKKYLKDKDVVYISLFGKNSLADVETDIVAKLYKYNKGLKKYTNHLDAVGNMASKAMGLPINISVGSLLSLFTPNDFKNIVICFDDFERLSDKVSLKDVMGLISQFKEQKECKIVMILNEKELDKLSDIDGKKHDEIFALYKEKVIDYSFHYQPSQEELFEAISEDIAEITFCDHQTVYEFFKKIDLKNIRIMKRSLYLLEKFSFIGDTKYHTQVVDEFIWLALNLFVFYSRCNYSNDDYRNMNEDSLNNIHEVMLGKLGSVDSTSQKPDKEKSNNCKQFFYNDLPYRHTNEQIEKSIYAFLEKHIVDKENLYSLLDINTSLFDKDHIQEEIYVLVNKLLSELSEDINIIINRLYEILSRNKALVPHIIRVSDLHVYFNHIKDLSPELINDQFVDDYILSYYDQRGNILKGGGYGTDALVVFTEKFYPHLKDELEKKIIKRRNQMISFETISKTLNRVQDGWCPEDAAILNSIDITTYIQYIEESGDFFYDVIDFIKKRGRENDFAEAVKHIKTALRELKKKSASHDWRISRLLEENKIELEENKS